MPEIQFRASGPSCRLISLFSIFLLGCFGPMLAEAPRVLHVSDKGSDRNGGSADRPFATLKGARDALREQKPAGGAVVEVHAGDYLLGSTFELAAEDAAPDGKRIIYRASPGEKVRLSGGRRITGFKPYKGPIVQADVSALGLQKVKPAIYGRHTGNVPGFELFFQGKRMPLARWPNQVPGDPRWGKWALIPRTTEATRQWFFYSGDRPGRWARPEEAQVHWFPWYNYMDQFVGVKSIEPQRKIIHLAQPAVYAVQPGRRFYIRNVFEELDAPGEWYLDRSKAILYFWPPAPLERGKVVASALASLIVLNKSANITIKGFTIETCREDAIVMAGGHDNTIVGCVIRNAQQDGISFRGGRANAAIGNDIYQVGRRGIYLSGGGRAKLVSAGNIAENNHIHHISRVLHTYSPGIQFSGCGNIARHNLIHDCPHMAVGISGNEHLFEFNEVHHAMLISSHGGAFYGGRDFTARGNVVRFNKFHDINGYGMDRIDREKGLFVYASPVRHLPGAFAIHLDDQISGFHIYGNLFYRIAHGVIRGGGGRDTVIENNIFYHAGWAVHIDNRGMGWQKRSLMGGSLFKRLKAMDTQHPPWSVRYPELVDIKGDRYGEPVDNVVRRNIFFQKGVLYDFSRVPSDRFTVDYNLIWRDGQPVMVLGRTYRPNAGGLIPFSEWRKLGFDTHSRIADPEFMDPDHDEYDLKPTSPAYALGFKPIPVEKIGLVEDRNRASPVPPPDPRKMSSGQVIEEYPIPGFKLEKRKTVELKVHRATAEIKVDGRIDPAEWFGADRRKAQALSVDYQGGPVRFKSYFWITHDGRNLYVAISNDVSAKHRLSATHRWGRDDAVEIAIQDTRPEEPASIFVFRGYPSGFSESSAEAGAPAELASRGARAVRFAARKVNAGRWDAEWQVPLAALGIALPRPASLPKLRFNVTTRKLSPPEWVMWSPTYGNSWKVEKAGTILLTLPGGG